MSRLFKNHWEKLLLGAALTAALGGCFWFWGLQSVLRRVRAQPVAPSQHGSPYEMARLGLPDETVTVWPEASSQSQGSDWLYEVFTPPVIYYDVPSRSFALAPPANRMSGSKPGGLELLAVRPEPYRLQLAGYFGGPGDYLAAFVSPQFPGTLLARAGHRFEALRLTFKHFEVKKVPVLHQDAWPVSEVAAFAVLRDDITRADVLLDSRTRRYTDTPVALLRFQSAANAVRVVHEGDTFSDDTSTYRVERIQLAPPEVLVTRQTAGLSRPDTMMIRPADAKGELTAVTSSTPTRLPGPRAAGIVLSNQ